MLSTPDSPFKQPGSKSLPNHKYGYILLSQAWRHRLTMLNCPPRMTSNQIQPTEIRYHPTQTEPIQVHFTKELIGQTDIPNQSHNTTSEPNCFNKANLPHSPNHNYVRLPGLLGHECHMQGVAKGISSRNSRRFSQYASQFL